ncbi:hypothetical protein CMI38_02870 [Candidatus Pacearchaeota archaeon]|nr:hypothetical protein [Candidatus Pacearchaeota archaeon]
MKNFFLSWIHCSTSSISLVRVDCFFALESLFDLGVLLIVILDLVEGFFFGHDNSMLMRFK